MPSVKLGSIQDKIRLSAWYRREQLRVFEALINVYANVIPTNPDVIKKVEAIIDDYIELVVPGSKEYKDKAQKSFITKQSAALESIYEKLKTHQTKK